MKEQPHESAATKIAAALRASAVPLTIDELCRAALGRVGARERNLARVNLCRLDDRGLLVRHEARYAFKNP